MTDSETWREARLTAIAIARAIHDGRPGDFHAIHLPATDRDYHVTRALAVTAALAIDDAAEQHGITPAAYFDTLISDTLNADDDD